VRCCVPQSQRLEQISRGFGDREGFYVILEVVAFDGRGAPALAGTNTIFRRADDTKWAYLAVLVVLGEQRVRLLDDLPEHEMRCHKQRLIKHIWHTSNHKNTSFIK
jgi:hypothetical protein